MKGRKIKSFVVPVAYTLAICVFVFSIYLLEGIVNNKMFANDEDSNIQYVDSEIVNVNEYIPVVSEDKNIIRPYKGDNISISKKYYDYDKEEEDQKDAIIFYEGIYMQNSGVDYTKSEEFDVVAVLDGTVISVVDNEIMGKTIEIRHSNDMISIYQSLNDVKVKVDDIVLKGQIIAKSGVCNLYNKDYNLHFEIYHNGATVNPEDYYDKDISELQ